LMMSITFEYNYKYPPPPSLLCHTCSLPAVDPCVSPFFPGKVFCQTCTVLEAQGGRQSYFLKAANLASMLDGLEVYCPFADFGCGACVPRGELGLHLQECQYIRIVCLNKEYGCKFGAKSRAEAIAHMQVCEFSSAIWHDIAESSKNGDSRLPSFPLPSHFPNQIGKLINEPLLKEEAKQKPNNKCTMCARRRDDSVGDFATVQKCGAECVFHSGTWNGFTYTQVQEWRFSIWKCRLTEGVKCVVHVPVEIAKTTTALGVGVVSVGALVGGAILSIASLPFALPEVLLVGGLLLVVPTPLSPVSLITSTVFSYLPSVLYNALYILPYQVLWGSSSSNAKKKEDIPKWTCCNQIGSNADPCEKQGAHTY